MLLSASTLLHVLAHLNDVTYTGLTSQPYMVCHILLTINITFCNSFFKRTWPRPTSHWPHKTRETLLLAFSVSALTVL